MVHGAGKRMQFRRRRKHLTDYKRRLGLLRSGRPRLVVRKSLRYTVAQVVSYGPGGDSVIVGGTSRKIRDLGWTGSCSNVCAAYLTGYYFGRLAMKKGVEGAILDAGLLQPTRGGRIYAMVSGMRDAGMEIPCDDACLPTRDRVEGKHLGESAGKEFEAVKAKIDSEKEE